MLKQLLVIDSQNQSSDYDKCINYIEQYKNNYKNIVVVTFNQNNNCEYTAINNYDMKNVITDYFSEDDWVDILGAEIDARTMAICFQLWDLGFSNVRVLSQEEIDICKTSQ